MALTLTISGQAVQHPREEYEAAIRNQTSTSFLGVANSYTCPRGMDPGSAWLLLTRASLNELDKNSYHTLKWSLCSQSLTIQSLCIVRSEAVNAGLAAAEDVVHLVEFQDVRRVLFLSSVNSQYNVTRPAPAATAAPDTYYTDSLNSGSVWTWQTLLNDLWGNLPSSAGTAPTLPYTPDPNPEDWRFIGVNAWEAVHSVLRKIGCTTAYDPVENEFSYVRLGATQTGLASSLTDLADRLEFDTDPVTDFNLANIPATVRVFFPRRELYHGIEKDTPDSDNWEMTPAVSKDYTTGITGASTGTVLSVWDDLEAEYNAAGSNSNSAALQTRADEIGENIANILDVGNEWLQRRYTGLTTSILPGSQITSVTWQDVGNGLVTILERNPLLNVGSIQAPTIQELWPLYPRVAQPVQIDDGSSGAGTPIAANGSGFYPGFVIRYTGSYEQLEACWIKDMTALATLDNEDRFHGRLSGNATHSGDIRPLYLIQGSEAGSSSYDFDVSSDEGTAVTIDAQDTLDFDASDALWSTEANSTKADRGIVQQVETDGVDSTIKRIKTAVDKSVAQEVVLTGSQSSGDLTVPVENGTRNAITLESTTGSPIDLTGTAASGKVAFSAHNPFHTITDDDSPQGSQDLDYEDTLHFESDEGHFEVTKAVDTVTAKWVPDFPAIGDIIMSWQAPILDTGKYYKDNGAGAADTKWALMDGSSNSSPGSAIQICDTIATDSRKSYFVRGEAKAVADSNNTAHGRTFSNVAKDRVDDDEATVTVADHPDHDHHFCTDACGDDAGTGITIYGFSLTANPKITSGVTAIGSGTSSAGILDHTVSITRGQGTSNADIEMTPPHKKLWFFEKVA